jgi:uncharacterized coiled-coil DUF342 family protein
MVNDSLNWFLTHKYKDLKKDLLISGTPKPQISELIERFEELIESGNPEKHRIAELEEARAELEDEVKELRDRIGELKGELV